MKVIESKLDTNSDSFETNSAYMNGLMQRVRDVESTVRAAEEKHRPIADKKGKMLPRERLGLLLDPGKPFLELYALAGHLMEGDTDGSATGANIIAGIGYVANKRCVVAVSNFAIKGGTMTRATAIKMGYCQQIAVKQRLPMVTLLDGGGANFESFISQKDPWGCVGFIEAGRGFCNQSKMSALGIPQILVLHGHATAGGAYSVALSDYVIMVRNQAECYLAGVQLTRAATGETSNGAELGGAEMHAQVSGTGEYLAENDADGIRIARDVMEQLPELNISSIEPRRDWQPPLSNPEELIGVVPADPVVPYDCREIIARLADGSKFFEFSAEIDYQTVCGHFTVEGRRCGVIANNGSITPNGAKKAAQFIQICDQSDTPLLFLHNTTGFLVGVEVEQAGAVKHGAKFIQAVANTRVPKISIMVGNSFGAGNYAMCSRALEPDFIFAWPTAKESFMGPDQCATTMRIVLEDKYKKRGVAVEGEIADQVTATCEAIRENLAQITDAVHSSARMMDDGIIDPRDSRRVLALLLDTCAERKAKELNSNTFGVARL